MEVQQSIDISASPEKIWDFLVEPEKILVWCITFKKFEYTSEQHSGIGTTFYVEEKAGGPLMKLKFEVIEWVENEGLAFKMTSGSGVKSYEQRWSISPTQSGSIFTFMEQIELPLGFIGKLIGKFIQRSSESHVKQMLAKLKNSAEHMK